MKVFQALANLPFLGSISARFAWLLRSGTVLTGLLLLPALSLGQTFVQGNSNTLVANGTTVSVPYASAETAGNLNVVVVGWSDTTSSVTSVVDDNTNTYVLAGTSGGNGVSQAIYYAANIVTPSNPPTVTVTFNQNAGFPDIRIFEYSGLSTTTPLDNWVGATGVSVLANSGPATTSTSDLILGAGTTGGTFTAAGLGFTLRGITSGFGDIVEDSDAALPAGSYNATAALLAGSTWVMQAAGFSTTAVTYPSAPAISSVTPITPATGPDIGGTSVMITGTNFQPGAVVLFGTAPGGISGLNCTVSSATTVTCLTPGDSAGVKDITVVNVDGKLASAIGAFTDLNVAPTFGSIAATSGPTNGSAVTITGTNFQGGAVVTVGGLPAGDVVVQNPTTITGNAPAGPVGIADVKVKNPDGGTVTSSGAFTYALGTGPVNFIQRGGAATASTATTVVGLITNLQTAGNLNVVIIGWGDTSAHVSSVVDTEGNTYVPALTALSGATVSQVIYYAKNITGDTITPNQVTVTFDAAAVAPDVQVLEYSGLDTASPLDAVGASTGSGALADTGACTTSAPVELIVGGATVGGAVLGPGPGFNLVTLTTPNGDAAEHQITQVAGSCEATATLTSSDWVIQAAAFKAVAGPAPDFTVTAAPASRTVNAGSPAAYTITVTGANGFTSPVALTCAALSVPTGATCAFAPSSVTPGATAATSALTISTSAATPVATSTVTVAGTFATLSHDATVSLTVNPVPDFTVAATALAPASVVAGATATSTITITPVSGFSGAVALSCSSVTPVVTGVPTCAFVPTSVAGASGTSVLTVSTSGTTPVGLYTATVLGTSGALSHSKTVTVTVTAPPTPDFTIAATPLSPASVAAGASATSTITIASLNGFSAATNLTCAITPVVTRAATCAFVPTSVAGGAGTSVLTVSTTAATTASLAPQSRGVFFAMLLPIGGLALLGTGLTSRKKKFWSFLFGCVIFSGLIFLAACGGSSSSGGGGGHPGTPAGTYTVAVTGTSGALTHSQNVTLVVH